MNDPWSTLIGSLSGAAPVTPTNWPTRSVHRTFDDAVREPERPSPKPVRARSRGEAPPPPARTAPPRPALAAPVQPVRRFSCPCTTCSAALRR